MHPEMIRAIAAQRVGDRQAEAQTRLRARLARKARKAQRRNASDPLEGVRIPDYVDGTFGQDARPSGPDGAGSPAPATAGERGVAAGRHRA